MSTPDQIEANRGYTGKSAGRTNEVPAGPSDAGRRAGRAGTRAISEFESQVLDRIRQSAASGHLTEFGLAMAAGVGHGTTHAVLCGKRRASGRVLSAQIGRASCRERV